jgi:hypothetical protein
LGVVPIRDRPPRASTACASWRSCGRALLVPLVIAGLTDAEGVVGILGPLHGVGFLILLYLTVAGAGRSLWGWWFPAIVVVTLGPPGSLIGDVRIRRELG